MFLVFVNGIYFKDEDSGSTKTWNYFKTAN